MCGILGVYPAVSKEKFSYALNLLEHRGPDGHGIWSSSDNIMMLGHRRLSIIDLTNNSHQPMTSGDYTITFNGEIYNFIEVRDKLISKGHSFLSSGDTEVALKAFIEWGKDCVNYFNGMWSFAIWNSKDKNLFLSRDRFGKKPLFYSLLNGKLVFGSEMKAISPFLDEVGLSDEFQWCKKNLFDYETSEHSLIKGINRFPAGSYGFWRPGQTEIKTSKFWNTKDHLVEVPEDYESQVSIFRDLFLDSCRIRMRSDVKIGTALSGGIDSTATITSMSYIAKSLNSSDINNDWQHAFVASFKGTFLDESHYAKIVTDYLGIPAHFEEIDAISGIHKIFEYLYLFEEIYNTSPIPMIDLYKSIKRSGISVTLDGHGADEMFCGYGSDIYRACREIGLNFKELQEVHECFRGTMDVGSSQLKMGPANIFHPSILPTILKHTAGSKKELIKLILHKLHLYKRDSNPGEGSYNEYLYRIFHQTILPTLLRNYDRYSMAASVEVRMPFMDHRLVSFVFSLPWESKVRKGYTKAVLRDALKGIMPEEIRLRKSKIGFNTPIVEWMKGPWKEFLLDIISSQDFQNSELIDSKIVGRKIKNVIFNKNEKFYEGLDAWTELGPFLWEKSVLKRFKQENAEFSKV